jgi:hypothetical protein
MTAWFKQGQPERLKHRLADMVAESFKPSKLCWSLVIKSWSAVGNLEEAENVLQNAKDGADVDLCNIVLHAWSQRNAIQAQAYFARLACANSHFECNLMQDRDQIVLTAWEGSNCARAKNQVEMLLRRMEQHAKEGIVQPTDANFELEDVGESSTKHEGYTLVPRRNGKVLRKVERFQYLPSIDAGIFEESFGKRQSLSGWSRLKLSHRQRPSHVSRQQEQILMNANHLSDRT